MHAPISIEELAALCTALRSLLGALPADAPLPTYQQVAWRLGLAPPYTVNRVIQALEQLMREDAAAGRPLLAARVVSRVRDGLPAPGFFALATRLGYHDGSEVGAVARAFHTAQLRALALAVDRVPPIG
ncbi:MAG: hypothetical protein IT479_03115 [Xanthomonadales bacterium]|nr:hypothetical protein [Xanthomonadales bacterium]MCC6592242.1 hypothetical protein [Xanthomonadales bacterium]MCE7932858.1 hypothetical protein [Xanthomonadales bacterium PRO6]